MSKDDRKNVRSLFTLMVLGRLSLDITHLRVDRVLGFSSSRPNWDSLIRRRVCSPLLCWFTEGVQTRLRERRWGNPHSDEGTDTVVL
jgi:hypothetical protein